MDRINGAGYVLDVQGRRVFAQEDVAAQRPPTEVTADWLTAVQEELLAVVGAANITPDVANNAQVLAALMKLAQSQTATAVTTTGETGAFVLTPSPALTAYAPNQRFRVKFHLAGNGADNMNISGLGNKRLKQYDEAGAKVAAVIAENQLVDVEYDGIDLVLLDPLPPAASQGNFQGFNSTNVGATLALSDMGKLYAFYGSTTGQTLTLPALESVPIGKNAIIVNQSSVSVTVRGNASENISRNTAGAGQTLGNTMILNPGDSIILSANGSTQWNAFGFASPGQFPNSLAASGYQKLPNGLLLQWFIDGNPSSANTGTSNFPIAFPTTCYGVFLTAWSPSAAISGPFVTARSTTSYSWNRNSSGSTSFFVLAIGA